MPRSFDSVFYGAAGTSTGDPVDDEFNRVSFLSHFDGTNNGVNNVFDDGSASNHTITAASNVTQGSFGPFARPEGEWGAAFDGSTTGYISVPTDSDFDLTDATTLEFWVFIPEDQTDGYVLGRLNTYWFAAPDGSRNTFTFMCMDTSTSWNYIHSSANIVYNQWYFVQLIYSGGTATFYLDGVSQGTATFTSKTGQSQPFYVGGYAGQLNAKATVSNIRFSNVARSTSVPTAPFAIDSNTKLLLCSSNRFTDRSSQAAVVSSYAGASVSAFGPFLTSEVYDPAVNAASAYFDGAADYLSSANSSDWALANGEFTIEAWVFIKPSGTVKQAVIGHWTNGSRGWQARVEPSGSGYKLRWTWTLNGNVDDSYTGSIVADFNAWNHVAFVRSSNTITLYVNGVAGGTVSGADIYTPNTPLVIGDWDSNAADFLGYMCDVRLVKGTAVYTGNFTPPTAPLTAITNTKLLLNMADAQAIDSAAQNNLTLFADAKISSTQSKFGGTSLYLDGTGDYAVINNSDAWAFGTGDFTVETWIYLDGTPATYGYIFDMRHSDQTEYTWALSFNYMGTTSDKLQWASNNTSPNAILSADYPPISEWVHIAVCRSGTTLRMFYNGTQSAINTSDSTDYRNTGNQGYIGVRYSVPTNANHIDAYYDDTRFSKFARYTANFTAPSEPFPDKGQ